MLYKNRLAAILDQDDFWLNQPRVISLIDSKVREQFYGYRSTHVALIQNQTVAGYTVCSNLLHFDF